MTAIITDITATSPENLGPNLWFPAMFLQTPGSTVTDHPTLL
jgi:hypothetical protein